MCHVSGSNNFQKYEMAYFSRSYWPCVLGGHRIIEMKMTIMGEFCRQRQFYQKEIEIRAIGVTERVKLYKLLMFFYEFLSFSWFFLSFFLTVLLSIHFYPHNFG